MVLLNRENVWTEFFWPHFLNICIRYRALRHFIAVSAVIGNWILFPFNVPSVWCPGWVLAWIVLAEFLVFGAIMLSWHIPHTFCVLLISFTTLFSCNVKLKGVVVFLNTVKLIQMNFCMMFLWSVCTATFQTSKHIFQ